jgi:hypothetical protein
MARFSDLNLPQVATSEQDALTIIINALNTLRETRTVSECVFILCPHHRDNDPSCGVNISTTNKVPLGYWHCLGCGEKGPWNDLAKVLNLPQIANWRLAERRQISAEVIATLEKLEILKPVSSKDAISSIAIKLDIRSYAPWPVMEEWRGFSGGMLRQYGTLMAVDSRADGDVNAILPVYVHGQLRGAVKALRSRPTKGTAYITNKGAWVKEYGLYPYDSVVKMCRALEPVPAVFLVEGPRDCLRFLANGYPALAVLGASAFGLRKSQLLTMLNTRRLVVVPDNDSGGEAFKKRVLLGFDEFLQSSELPVDLMFIDLPKTEKKLDPYNISEKLFKKICKTAGYTVK